MATRSVVEHAVRHAARQLKIESPHVVDRMEARDPAHGPVHRITVVDPAHANGPAHQVFVDDQGEALTPTPALELLFDRTAAASAAPPGTPALDMAPVTIDPSVNVLTLGEGDSFTETITVTIPKDAGPVKADVYFLADTTGSMGGILGAVQAGANTILTALAGLGVDLAFGVGNYKDFASGDPYGFQHQLGPTSTAASVAAAINTWSAAGGGDTPEAALFALESLAVPPGGTIGWRPGSKRIVVWFGDAPSHDPICTAVSGGPSDVTEATATAKLKTEGVVVLAISTATPGLDDNPKSGASGYAACGGPGGLPNQATRITGATGGAIVTGINPATIVSTVISLVSGSVAGIKNVTLVPSASVTPFVTSITPSGGYGPLAGDQPHTLKFEVIFHGAPCKPEPQVIGGSLDVVADGSVVASKRVQITVPPCAFVYSVKFVCGVQPNCGCTCASVRPGVYATEINIHNYGVREVQISKRVIPVVLASAPVGRAPKTAGTRATDSITLKAQSATMDDCCRLAELLFGAQAPSPMPLSIGFLEITASAEVAVTAVYTASGGDGGVSLAVEQIAGRRR